MTENRKRELAEEVLEGTVCYDYLKVEEREFVKSFAQTVEKQNWNALEALRPVAIAGSIPQVRHLKGEVLSQWARARELLRHIRHT